MLTLKSFFRKKVTKIYLIILSVLFIAFLLLEAFILYFSNMQDDIFYNYSELVVINDYDIFDDLIKISNIKNVDRKLAFRRDENYKVFGNASYKKYDPNGNLLESYENTEEDKDKILWEVMKKAQLEDYVIVVSDKEFDFELNDNEIVIGIMDFWYDSYDDSYYENIINEKIGFIFDETNIEFTISDVISVEQSILVISDKLYNNLMESGNCYAYTAKITSIKNQSKLKDRLQNLSKNDNYLYSIVTFYKNDASDNIANLYDLLDVLNLISYISVAIFLIILIIIIKNIVNDQRKNTLLNRKIGFNKIQIKMDILKNLVILYLLSIIIGLIGFAILVYITKIAFNINLFLINIAPMFKLLGVGLILNLFIVMITSVNLKKQKYF